MAADDDVGSPCASPDDAVEKVRRALGPTVKDIVSAQQRNEQLAFEREKEALGAAMKAREEKIRALRQEVRQLERDNAADVDKKRCLEAKHHTTMRKYDWMRENWVFEFRQSAPSEAPPRAVVEPGPSSVTTPAAAASMRLTRHETEDQQAQDAGDMQRRRSSRLRRPSARADPGDTDTELGIGSSAARPPSPSQRTSSPPIMHRQGKRRRNAQDDGEDDENTNRQRPKRSRYNSKDRTVSFEEVYGDGDPEYRHTIVEYPKDSGNWFIIRCDQCGFHFNRNPLHGGAKHLNGATHGYFPKTSALAVQELGFRVLGCDKGKAKRNNDAFDRAVEAGYVPFKRRGTDQARGQRQESAEPGDEDEDGGQPWETHGDPPINSTDPQGRHRRGKPFEGITDPIDGRMYRAWFRGRGFYAALKLPLGSFGTVGVTGDIFNMDRQENAPKCYERTEKGLTLKWASGYDDGGPKVRARSFPMMYLHDSDLSFKKGLVIPPSLGWVPAKNLRPFDVSDPECRRTKGFDNARIFLGRTNMSIAISTERFSAGGENGRESGPDGQATSLRCSNAPVANRADQHEDGPDENTREDDPEPADKRRSSMRNRRVSASASPPCSATRATDQDHQEEEEDKEEYDVEERDKEDDEEGDGCDQDDDGEIVDDQETEDEIWGTAPGGPDSAAAHQLLSKARIPGEAAAAAGGHEGYSQDSPREPNMSAPLNAEPRLGDLEPTEGVASQQDPAHERSNQDEQTRQGGSMGTQNLVGPTDNEPLYAAAQSATASELGRDRTAIHQTAPTTLPSQGLVLDNAEGGGLSDVHRDIQFFMDLHRSVEEFSAESRAGRLQRTGGPAGKGVPLRAARRGSVRFDIPQSADPLQVGSDDDDPFGTFDNSPGAGQPTPSEIARRALSLNMGLRSNEEFEEFEEPFRSGWNSNFSLGASATRTNKEPEQPTRATPLPPPTGPLPPRTKLSQFEHQGSLVHIVTGQQTPTQSPAAIMQAQSLNQAQRGYLEQTQRDLIPSSAVGPDHRQHEIFPHFRYTLVQPLPATPGPLPAPTPHSAYAVPQPTGGLPPPSRLVYHFSKPTHTDNFWAGCHGAS